MDNKTKKLLTRSGLACVAMRHVSSQIRDFFPDLSQVLDKAERQLMEEILKMYEEQSDKK